MCVSFDNFVHCEDESVEDCGFLAFGVWRVAFLVSPGRKRVLQFPSKQTILFLLDQRVASLTERADLFWSILTKSCAMRKKERKKRKRAFGKIPVCMNLALFSTFVGFPALSVLLDDYHFVIIKTLR